MNSYSNVVLVVGVTSIIALTVGLSPTPPPLPRQPYPGKTALAVARGVTSGMRPDIPGRFPPRLVALINRGWAGNEHAGRPSFTEILHELESIEDEEGSDDDA